MISSLCMFGDSVSKGVAYDAAMKKYIFLKESFVNIFSSITGIAVDNYSKFGCTLKKGIKIVERYLPKLKDYDYTIFEFGGNDCNFNWKEISDDPDGIHLPQTPIDEFKSEYKDILYKVENSGANPVILNLPPLDAVKFFNWISRGNNPQNILKWLGDVDAIYRWHDGYNTAVCQVAEETGVPLIDIRSAFLQTPNYTDLLCDDGMHPNKSGHQLIAGIVEKYAA